MFRVFSRKLVCMVGFLDSFSKTRKRLRWCGCTKRLVGAEDWCTDEIQKKKLETQE